MDASVARNLFLTFVHVRTHPLMNRAYLPRLIPVEVDEPIARVWFKSLLSGIEFLHTRSTHEEE